MDCDIQEKENRPFLIARRPAKGRKMRLKFGDEENWRQSIEFGSAGQDVDDEVFSLCNKFSETSIRCDQETRARYTFENIKSSDDKAQFGFNPVAAQELVTPAFTPHTSPSGRITPRKPLRPLKSATKSDPTMKGVIFTVRSGIKRSVSMEEFTPDVFIDSVFSSCSSKTKRPRSQPCSDSKLRVRRTGRRRNCKTPVRLFASSGSIWQSSSPVAFCSEDSGDSPPDSMSPNYAEDLGVVPIHVEKECASCGTSKTPLWRDAEDGTHLCNACGIRWKKYRVRCVRCWYIPKKEEKMMKTCPSCDSCGTVKMAVMKPVKKQ